MHLNEESVLNDNIYPKKPDIDNGSTWNHLFFGAQSLVLYVYDMKTNKHFVDILEDNICTHISMIKLI